MASEDVAIEHYYSLRPTEFHDLNRLEISQTNVLGEWEVSVQVELQAKQVSDHRRLVLTFRGVKNLTLVPSASSILYFSFIQVFSIEDRQWESENYKVFESEQDSEFSFLCRDFDATILTSESQDTL